MHRTLGLITAIMLLVSPLAASAQDARAVLNDVAKALGAPTVKSIQYTGNIALADNITRLGLAVGDLLPLHGRLVPLAELHRTIGRAP